MRNTLCLAMVIGSLGAAGCATNSVVGQAGPQVGRYSGDVGVTGYGTNLTIKSGSQIPKLSIIGDNCTVMVEEGVAVGRIEFWGNGNEISLPEDLTVSIAQVGSNRIIRRSQVKPSPTNGNAAPALQPTELSR